MILCTLFLEGNGVDLLKLVQNLVQLYMVVNQLVEALTKKKKRRGLVSMQSCPRCCILQF